MGFSLGPAGYPSPRWMTADRSHLWRSPIQYSGYHVLKRQPPLTASLKRIKMAAQMMH
jgi:hypothetical protein